MRPSSLAVLTLALVLSVSAATAGTEPGYQYTYLAGLLPDTLHVESSPFVVLGNIYADSTLVEPGVELRFTEGVGLELSAARYFHCIGTEDSPVLFRDAGLGSWNGIRVAPDADSRHVRLSHSSISGTYSYGVQVTLNYNLSATDIFLDSMVISGCPGAGLDLQGGPAVRTLSVVGTSLEGCNTGINIGYWGSGLTVRGCTVSNNVTGIVLYAPITLTENTTCYNQFGIVVHANATVNWCAIHDNVAYDASVYTSVMNYPSLNFRYNDWGTTTTAEMQAEGLFSDISTILDWWDNHSYSLVDYSGFSGGSTGVAGVRVVPTSWGAVKSMFR